MFLNIFFHVTEVFYRVIYIFYSFLLNIIVTYYYIKSLSFVCIRPFFIKTFEMNYIYTNIFDIIYIYLKLAIVYSFFFLLPILFFHFCEYNNFGFFLKKKKLINFSLYIYIFVYIYILLLFYFCVFPLMINLFLIYNDFISFSSKDVITFNLEVFVVNYLNFIINTSFIFLFFILSLFLLYIYFLKNKNVINNLIYLLFIFYLLISPPDILMQIFFIFVLKFVQFQISFLVKYLNKIYMYIY